MATIIKFVENFFDKINSKVTWKENILVIKNVNSDFEKRYGKPSPYYFVFDKNHMNEKTDLVTSGSTLIKIITDYLKNIGKTSILQLEIDSNQPLKEIENQVKLNKFKISSPKIKKINDYIIRFTFLTQFQYKNEKNQVTTHIYFHDNEIIDNFDLNNYKTVQGKSSDAKIKNLKELFDKAKISLKTKIDLKVKEFSKKVNIDLEIAINRIKSHYVERKHEIFSEVDIQKDKLKKFQIELDKTSNLIKKDEILSRIEKIKIYIKKIKDSFDEKKANTDQEFLINEEKYKHSLNITNNLLNTAIIYYPIFEIQFFFTKKNITSHIINTKFNPLTKRLNAFKCNKCNKDLTIIEVCSQGHLTCEDCKKSCTTCAEILCESCITSICSVCKIDICKKCKIICKDCGKDVCKSHIVKDYLTDDKICTKCAIKCTICNNYTRPKYFKTCKKCKSKVCPKCAKTVLINSKPVSICKKCN